MIENGQTGRRIRAVIFDVYRTLLVLGPVRSLPVDEWHQLCITSFGREASLDWKGFERDWEKRVVHEHENLRKLGIANGEIHAAGLVREILPEAADCSLATIDAFLLRMMRAVRSATLAPFAWEILQILALQKVVCGIASNAQAYSLVELEEALPRNANGMARFHPSLLMWSHLLGVAKPSPLVFRILTARLAHMDVEPGEILMVGDRWDRDIAPARAQGWQVYQIEVGKEEKSWCRLRDFLQEVVSPA